jgi:hypothetical protein
MNVPARPGNPYGKNDGVLIPMHCRMPAMKFAWIRSTFYRICKNKREAKPMHEHFRALLRNKKSGQHDAARFLH